MYWAQKKGEIKCVLLQFPFFLSLPLPSPSFPFLPLSFLPHPSPSFLSYADLLFPSWMATYNSTTEICPEIICPENHQLCK